MFNSKTQSASKLLVDLVCVTLACSLVIAVTCGAFASHIGLLQW